jgi:hypothetical protein
LQKLWFAAVIAVTAVGVTAACAAPVTGAPAPVPATTPTLGPSTKTTTTKPRPKPTTTTASAVPVVGEPSAGPAVAGPCRGVVIRPGQNAQAVVNSQPPGSTVCFAAGLHRIGETIRPKANMTIASSARAVLTGSVPLTSWSRSGARWVTRGALPAAYGKSGQCEDNVANICHLREQVFVDGTHLTRVASLAAVTAGTFYADYAADAIYLGGNPAGRAVEMSRTSPTSRVSPSAV